MRTFGRSCEALASDLVAKRAELGESDTRAERERMGHGFGHGAAARLARFSEAGADRPVDGLLERDALLARALLQKPRKVVVDSERRAHGTSLMLGKLMSRHQAVTAPKRSDRLTSSAGSTACCCPEAKTTRPSALRQPDCCRPPPPSLPRVAVRVPAS